MGRQEKSEILAIPNQYKDTLDNLINNLDDSSDNGLLAMLRWIVISNGHILSPENNKSKFVEGDFPANRLQKWLKRSKIIKMAEY